MHGNDQTSTPLRSTRWHEPVDTNGLPIRSLNRPEIDRQVCSGPTKRYRNWDQSAPMRSSHWTESIDLWTVPIRDQNQFRTVLEGFDQSDRTVMKLKFVDTVVIYVQSWTQWSVNRPDPSPVRVLDGPGRSVSIRLNGVRTPKDGHLHDQLDKTSLTAYDSNCSENRGECLTHMSRFNSVIFTNWHVYCTESETEGTIEFLSTKRVKWHMVARVETRQWRDRTLWPN